MTQYPTQSHYPDTEVTNPFPILLMPSARLGSDKYQFESNWFDSTGNRTPDRPHFEASALRIRLPRPVASLQ